MLKIIAWNIAHREEAWHCLLDTDADIALLQEATEPPSHVARRIGIDPTPWRTAGAGVNRPWRAAVIRLSDRVGVEWLDPKPLADAHPGETAISRLGTLAAATVTPTSGEPLMVVSMYALWEKAHHKTKSDEIYADASAHRLISDLSAFICRPTGHRILAAGDLNILHGYGEHGSSYWAARYATVFSRMSALGLSYVGPYAPSGRRAAPWPDELPHSSNNVPTYHHSRQTPASATRQLDFVFTSNHLSAQVRVAALNEPDEWGPSDHCRVEIKIED